MDRARVRGGRPVGLLVTAILVVNNLRDIGPDTRAGKRTLAVMFGRTVRTARVPRDAHRRRTWCPCCWSSRTPRRYPALLPLLSLPLAVAAGRVSCSPTATHAGSIPVLKGTARLQLVFALLFALGLALHRVVGGP